MRPRLTQAACMHTHSEGHLLIKKCHNAGSAYKLEWDAGHKGESVCLCLYLAGLALCPEAGYKRSQMSLLLLHGCMSATYARPHHTACLQQQNHLTVTHEMHRNPALRLCLTAQQSRGCHDVADLLTLVTMARTSTCTYPASKHRSLVQHSIIIRLDEVYDPSEGV